jgi:hypothetical protein
MTDKYLIERQQQKLGLAAPKEEKVKVRISMKSLKRKVEENLYLKKKKEYLTKNIRCEVKGCNRVSEDVHHKKGRVGKLLYDEKYFLAVCREHHTEIESHPELAIKNGYSLSRLTTENI